MEIKRQFYRGVNMIRKKINYWVMCFVLGYIESRQNKFKIDSEVYNAYKIVSLDIQGEYKYQ
jgi:hypothetical protein